MGPHCITFVVLYIKGDYEGTDLERAIARESIWRRSLRGNRFGDGHCDGTDLETVIAREPKQSRLLQSPLLQ